MKVYWSVQRSHIRTLLTLSNDCGVQAASRRPQHGRSPTLSVRERERERERRSQSL